MKPVNLVIVCGFSCLIALAFYLASNTFEGHYKKDGQLYKALHIFLPGYVTVNYPEQIVDLSKWVGTKYGALTATNPDGTENAEASAGLALKAMGVYGSDYDLEKNGDHYVLHRPERNVTHFSLKARYRLGKGVPVTD